jgi:DNA-binding SARP family transcriptional activator
MRAIPRPVRREKIGAVTAQFLLLGRVETWIDGRPVALTRRKVRDLLVCLLLARGRPVSVETLVRELWEDEPPVDARGALHVHVSRLRSALGASAGVVADRDAYALRVETDSVDAFRFERLAAEGAAAFAAGHAAHACELLDQALALWRGPALAGMTVACAAREAARLDELRAAATEDRFDAQLALGADSALVAGLEEAVAEWPYRERLWRHLMLALYRAGRQADALEAYRRAHRVLTRDLGIHPSPALRRLQRAVLVQDPSLDARPGPPEALAEARRVHRIVSHATEFLPDGDAARVTLLPELAQSLMDLGEWNAAGAVLDDAIRLARARGDEQLEAQVRLATVRLRMRSDPAVDPAELVELAEGAIALLEPNGDVRRLADAWSMLGGAYLTMCQAARAEPAFERAVELARQAGDTRCEVRSLHLLVGVALLGPLPVVQGIGRCELLLERDDLSDHARGAAMRGLAALRAMAGDIEGARAAAAEDRLVLERLDAPIVQAGATSVYGLVELYAGDAAESERQLRLGYDVLTRSGEKSMRANVAAQLALAAELQGRYDEAYAFTLESEADAGPRSLEAQVPWRGVRARLLARCGEARDAERLAREAVALALDSDYISLQGDALLDLASVHALAGSPDLQADAAGQAVELYRRKGNRMGLARARAALDTAGTRRAVTVRAS